MRSIHSYLHEMTRSGLIIFIFCGLFFPVLAQPTLTNPGAGSTVYVGVTFSWGAIGGVSSYDLLIDTQSDFASANAITINNGTATSKALPAGSTALSFGTSYYWKVRANLTAGGSVDSEVRQFSTWAAVSLSSPTNGATNQPTSLTIDWLAHHGVSSYELQLDTSPDFNTAGLITATKTYISSSDGNSDTQHAVNGLTFGATYYWRVRAVNSKGTSSWSGVRSFTTHAQLQVQSPNDGATNMPPYVDIFFTRFDGLTQVQYEFDTDNTFNNGQGDKYTGTVNAGSLSTGSIGAVSCYLFDVNGLKFGKTYYYRIRGVNASSTSDWSAVRTLTIRSTLQVQSPNDGATNMPPYVDIFFTRFDGLTQVQYEFDTDNTFNNGQGDKYTGTVNAGSLSTGSIGAVSCYLFGVNGLKFGKTYYYRIRGVNASSTSDWSTVRTLTTIAAPVLVSPANNATNVSTAGINLTWNDLAGETGYQVQMSTSNLFTSLIINANRSANTTSQASGALTANTTYYWRVRAKVTIASVDYYSAWAERAFTTGSSVSTLPATPSLLSPSNNATGQSVDVTLSWSEVTGASYVYEYSSDVNFITNVQSGNVAEATTSVALSSLGQGIRYYWRVRSVSGGLASPWSGVFSFVTTAPKIPVTVSISDNTATYNGGVKNVTVTTTPAGVSHSIAYSLGGNAVSNPVNAGTYDVTITITDNAYELNGAGTGTLTINKAVLTATADDKTREYGATNPVATITYTGFQNGETASILDTQPAANIASSANSTAGAGTTHAITPSGGSDNNYSYAYVNGTLTISKATLTATADDKTREYGSANPAATIIYAGFKNGETAAVLDTQPTISFAASANGTANAGTTHAITLSGGTDNNYSYTYVNGTLTISKAIVTATADDKTREYGSANPTATITYTGFKNGETAAVLDTQPTISFAASANGTASAGTTHAITPSGGSDNNYTYAYVNGTLTISKATLTATADDKTREYGSANPTATITYAGFKNGETAAVLDTQPTISFAASANGTANAGTTHAITPSGGSDNNYSYAYVNGTLTIGKAALTATADDKTREYGSANPTATITYAGFKNGETAAVLDTQPTISFAASANGTANAGTTHAITPSGGSDNNYSYAYVNGTLTISKATLTATADDKTREYGSANPTATITYAGFKNGETAAVLDTQPTASFASSANSTANAGTTHAITLSGGSDNNYEYLFVSGQLSIVKASQSISFAEIDDKFLGDGSFTLSATTSSGLPVSYSSSDASMASVSGNVVTMHTTGTVAITASQAGDGNYHAATPVGQTFTIVNVSRVMQLSTSLISFGDVIIGRSASVVVSVTNTGTGPLTITNIEHPAEVQVDNSSFTVSSGGTVQITVTYTPAIEGTITGNLVFVSDATGGTTTLAIEGTAILVTDEAEVPLKNLIRIFPNPVMTDARIVWEGSEALSRILVQDAQGRVVSSWSISEQLISDTGYTVNLGDLNSGLYVIRFITEKGNIYQRTIIKL
jgi:hypothetical protein